MNVHAPSEPHDPRGLEAALRAIGPVRYHDLHPFHGLLHDGKLNKARCRPGRSTASSTRPQFRARTPP